MRMLHVGEIIEHVLRAWKNRRHTIALSDPRRLNGYLLDDIGLGQYPESRAAAWWRKDVIPVPGRDESHT